MNNNDIRQISVFLENKPGTLFNLTTLLKENAINLLALNVAETEDYGLARLIADKTDKAVEILKANNFLCQVNPVVCVAVPDVAGGLNKILEIISASNADISYMYSILANTSDEAYMVLKAKTAGSIKEALEKNGIKTASAEILGIK